MRITYGYYEPPVLPGLEGLAAKPSLNLKKAEKHRDLYKLRLLAGLTQSNQFGNPQLKGYVPRTLSKPIAFHDARALWRKGRSLKGYYIHFFIEDEKFDCVRNHPERYLAMFRSADFIIAPDFSTYRNFPFPIVVGNTFDNLTLACYYEHNGVNVVANVFWSLPMFYDFTFSGQPVGGVICVSSNSIDIRDKKGCQHWLHGYREAVLRLKPVQVIRFGKVIPGEDKIYSNPVKVEELNPYVKRMRYGR